MQAIQGKTLIEGWRVKARGLGALLEGNTALGMSLRVRCFGRVLESTLLWAREMRAQNLLSRLHGDGRTCCGTRGHGSSQCTPQAWPHSRPARRAMNEPDKEYAAAPSAGLQAQDMDAVAIRTHHADVVIALACLLWPFARTGHTDVIIVQAWMLWPFACTGHTDAIIARSWMLWPFARTGHTNIIIVRAWMLWPFARTGHTDVIILRAGLLMAIRTHW